MADKLETVNERNCGTKVVHVRVFNPRVHTTQKKADVFTCVLVSESGLYCMAEQMVWGDNPAARARTTKALTDKWTPKSSWALSKLKMVRKKDAFHGSPHPCVLQLSNKTMVAKVLPPQQANKLPSEVEPSMSIHDVLELSQDQAVDLCGFVTDISTQGAFKDKKLAQQLHNKEPVYIFGAYLVKSDNGGVHLTVRNSTIFTRPAGSSPKVAAMLAAGARDLAKDDLTSLSVYDSTNYKDGPAVSSTSAILDMLLQSKAVAPDKLFEIPAASFSLSDTENLLTKAGDRVWASVRMSDYTGSVDAKITETAALALTGCADKTEFQDEVAQGSMTWSRARVRATLAASRGAQDDQANEPRLAIVCAEPCLFDVTEPLLAPQNDSRLVPTTARAISMSATGKLCVAIGSSRFLASGAILLVEATKDPDTTPRDDGFAITNYVTDVAETDTEQKTAWMATTACPTRRLGRYASTKKDRALILVTFVNGTESELTVADMWKLAPGIDPGAFTTEIAAAADVLTNRLTRSKRKADDDLSDFFGPAAKRIHKTFCGPASIAE
ncbi:unnamed protein product [Prorocentrum cordatum]|uniref:Uncharacterized protein n=1 Tax=Prorocentrum cordatum TaxID=2364126 RepID=A0ABN9U880_9DINO|nr:unnamed protein product [Polarella glacialis]